MVRIDRVYTRVGDGGDTHLVGGQKVSKDSLRIEAYGTVDELNAILGICRELGRRPDAGLDAATATRVGEWLARLQQELFDLGSELATREEDLQRFGEKIPRVTAAQVERLEHEIDEMNEELPKLTSFILPGGGLLAAQLHQARTVCRRVERMLVGMHRQEALGAQVIPFVNRLSDHLFVLSRWVCKRAGETELLWDPKRAR
jgi:cob(I)alamin adenosyltransferase